ncbi:MAG: endonuclease/exonuclease/phosphatase family protein [Anaerolineae bacterium]|nr:endonuclease/exonuclease/phosphatase family protein [Anaerolineae bacterium]
MGERLRRTFVRVLPILEAALVGVLFIGATRFLIGMLYSRIGGSLTQIGLDPSLIPAGTPGITTPNEVANEAAFLVYMLALPLLTLIVGRFRVLLIAAAGLVAAGRLLMIANTNVSVTIAAAMAFGGGLAYIALLIRHRVQIVPLLFVMGFSLDQVFRAVGNTLDITWNPAYTSLVYVLGGGLAVLAVLNFLVGRNREPDSKDAGLLPFWGGIGLGGLLFMQLSLLALPNAIAGRSTFDYTNLAPLVILATALPLIPAVRQRISSFISLFDPGTRGWSWMLVAVLLIVIGTRFQGIIAGLALVLSQFAASLLWWWVARPRTEKERSFTGLWLILGVAFLVILVLADNFTYEYAYVQNLSSDLAFLNPIVPALLRGFRGMGLGVLLLGVFLAALPMILSPRRLPWSGDRPGATVPSILAVAAMSIGVAVAVQPPLVSAVRDVSTLRIGTYNIHAGFNEFYSFDLEAIARTIQQSGADVVLLQQVESGRLTSFGVDQALWLARRLGMDRRFFATNEGLQGLAILSRVEITSHDAVLLTSSGNQTGLQWVQIRPDDSIITLYNTRLEFLLDTGDGRSIEDQEQDQQRQLSEIFAVLGRNYADGNPGRMLVGGTFNNIPDSSLSDAMRSAGFVDPFAGLATELSATLWRTGYPRVQLDYLWVWQGQPRRPNVMIALGANTVNTAASDHRMAVIEASIRTQ